MLGTCLIAGQFCFRVRLSHKRAREPAAPVRYDQCLPAYKAASSDNADVTYEIDGKNFDSLEGFRDEINRVLLPDWTWNGNLDAFNDILRGGFGTPDQGFTLRWKNHHLSRERLGYPETVRELESRLHECHPANRATVAADLERARSGVGPTVFDWLVEIIRIHGPGGEEAEDNVTLELV